MRGKARQKTGEMAFQAKRTANAMVLTLVLCLAYWRKRRRQVREEGVSKGRGNR